MSELPKNWQSMTSGDLCEYITSGSRDWKSFYSNKGPLFVRTQDINQDRLDLSDIAHVDLPAKIEGKRSRVQSGDLLVTITGANVGRVALVPEDIPEAYVSQSVGLMRLKDKRNGPYLHYYLQSDQTGRKQVLNLVYGIGRPILSLQNLRDIPVALPPLSEQRQIVAEIEKQFTRLEAGMVALRRVQANLKRYRAAVLKTACEGRLVPTEAELHRQRKTKSAQFETGAELLSRILAERRKSWTGRGKYKEPTASDTANLPPLPEGWTWATTAQLSFLDVGFAFKSAEFEKSGIRLLRGDNLEPGKMRWLDTRYWPEPKVDEFRHLLIREGEIVLAMDRPLISSGLKIARARTDDLPCLLVQRMARFRPVVNSMTSFLFMTMNTHGFIKHLLGGQTGTQLPHISGDGIQSFPVALPPLAEQTRIVAEVERRLNVVEELEVVVTANLQHATRLRQSILQKAFTGQLVKPEPAIDLTKLVPSLKPEHVKPPNRHFARALLSAEIVHRLHNEPTFGRIKHQKIFHLCEHIAQIEEIEGEYHREVAGPLDNKLIYANEAELRKQKWYQEVHRTSFGHAYEPLAKAGVHRKYVEGYWPDKLPVVEKLIELMRKWDTDRCEIFCTAYAAWNDLLLWGKEPTEAAILNEVLNRWHESKKRFPQERWCKAIGWMKEKGFIPTGFGKPTSKPA